jgi:uncharacterized protein (TIGR00251 family)
VKYGEHGRILKGFPALCSKVILEPMIRSYKDGSLLEVYVQPRASRTEIVGPFGGALKIKLKAPPAEGKANEELTVFLAKVLGLPRKKIKLQSVSSKLLPGKIAYLRISHFIGGTNSELRKKWQELKKEAGGERLRDLIRGNSS